MRVLSGTARRPGYSVLPHLVAWVALAWAGLRDHLGAESTSLPTSYEEALQDAISDYWDNPRW